MNPNSKVALIAGASGLTGAECLDLLLKHENYHRVIALVRKTLPLTHEKLQQIQVDFDHLETCMDDFSADDVYCCLGTTIKKAGSQANFRKVDYDYIVNVAKAAYANGAKRFLLVSSLGASSKSSIFYSRVKGETEEAVAAIPFEEVHIFRPSLLLGNRKEHRFGESLAIKGFKALGFLMVGPLAVYKGIEVKDVAKAMISIAQSGEKGKHIYLNDEIQRIADKSKI
ncbi:MAG: oxidoreductase [Sphingobacteriales bacterium]|nr:MAG: oxidoreductase [Sphingobacteriales bacterium]